MESNPKRAVPSYGLRVIPQSRVATASPPAATRRLGPALLPLICAVFVAASALALLAPTNGEAAGSGVRLDAHGVVVSVDPSSEAWAKDIRPGWLHQSHESDFESYSLGNNIRAVFAGHQGAPGLPGALAVIPSLMVLVLAAGLVLARQRRTGATLAVVAAVLASPVWAARFGPAGGAVAVVPAGLAAALPWQFARSLRMLPARVVMPAPRAKIAALVALVAVSVAVFVAATLVLGLVAGVAGVSSMYIALAWIVVVRWRVRAAATGHETRSRFAVARTVAIEMLPFSDRVRRRGAQAERDRLASDLHAEVLPAIASTAAELDRRGATHEADQLRGLAASVRDLVSDRRLPILEDRGLVAAAEWLAESLEQRSTLTIEIDLRGDSEARPPIDVERAGYRIVQLALDNVIRHAEAANAVVAIAGGARRLDLSVADDGRGLGPDDEARSAGTGRLGLVDIRAEAESVGASLEIAPRPPHGTIVNMRWRG